MKFSVPKLGALFPLVNGWCGVVLALLGLGAGTICGLRLTVAGGTVPASQRLVRGAGWHKAVRMSPAAGLGARAALRLPAH